MSCPSPDANSQELPMWSEERRLAPTDDIAIAPAAGVLPMSDLSSLIESIRQHGQRRPGNVLLDSAGSRWLIDGRRRREATRRLQLPFVYRETNDLCATEAEFVLACLSEGDECRFLSEDQKAMCAVAIHFSDERAAARDRKRRGISVADGEGGSAAERLARKVGAKRWAVRCAIELFEQEDATSLVDWVKEGGIRLSRARKMLAAPPELRSQLFAAVKNRDRSLFEAILAAPPDIDATGQPIPNHLRDVFGTADDFLRIERVVSQLETRLESVGRQLKSRSSIVNQVRCALADLKSRLSAVRPYVVCSACQGTGCAACSASGWQTYDEARRGEVTLHSAPPECHGAWSCDTIVTPSEIA